MADLVNREDDSQFQIKQCRVCGEVAGAETFRVGRATCVTCYNIARRSHYWRPENRSEIRAKRRLHETKSEVIARRKELRSTPEAKAKERETMIKYKSKPEVRKKIRAQRDVHVSKPHIRARMVFLAALQRARSKGLNFDLTDEWVLTKVSIGLCELTGLPFEFGRPQNGWTKNPYTPSVDRIFSAGGYTQDNCRLVLTAVNLALGEWGADVLERIAIALVDRRK